MSSPSFMVFHAFSSDIVLGSLPFSMPSSSALAAAFLSLATVARSLFGIRITVDHTSTSLSFFLGLNSRAYDRRTSPVMTLRSFFSAIAVTRFSRCVGWPSSVLGVWVVLGHLGQDAHHVEQVTRLVAEAPLEDVLRLAQHDDGLVQGQGVAGLDVA